MRFFFAVIVTASSVWALCPDQSFVSPPEDPARRGEYPVGAVSIDGFTGEDRDWSLEVWYPAQIGSDIGLPKKVYDPRVYLPPRYEGRIPDGLVDMPCECFDSIPAATDGPFPVIVFIHGTAAFKEQAMHQMVHLASRGFVAISANHPGIYMRDLIDLGNGRSTNQVNDTLTLLRFLRESPILNPQLSFLNGVVDMSRLSISGQSAGGNAAVALQDEARVLIPMSAGGAISRGESRFVFGADIDRVVPYSRQVDSYNTSSAPKRLLGLARSGHLGTTPDLCYVGRENGGFIEIAIAYGIYEALLFRALFDGCDAGVHFPPEVVWPPLNYAAAAGLEEILMCDSSAAAKLSMLPSIYPEAVFQYEEQLS